MMQNNGIPE